MASKNIERREKSNHRSILPGKLDASKLVLEALSRAMDGVAIGIDNRIIFCNKSWIRLHRWPEDFDPVGKNILEIERKELMPIVHKVLDALKKKSHYRGTFEVLAPQGDLRHFSLRVDNLRKREGIISVAILREITELENSKRQIEEKNRELSVLTEIDKTASEAKDVKTVTARMLELLGEFMRADAGGVYKYEKGKQEFTLIDSFGIPQKIIKKVRSIPASDPLFAKTLICKRSIVLEEDMPEFGVAEKDIRRDVGLKRVLCLRLKSGFGGEYVVIFARKSDEIIQPSLRRFLELSAVRFGAALDRVGMLERIEEREREIAEHERSMNAFMKINDCIGSSTDRSVVLRGMLRVICRYLSGDCACIISVDRGRNRAVLLEREGRICHIEKAMQRLSSGASAFRELRELARMGEAFILEEKIPLFARYRDGSKGAPRIARTLGAGIKGSGNEDYYIFVGFTEGKKFDLGARRFLEICVRRFSLALERLNNIEQLREREVQLKRLSARLADAEEETRRKFALSIHEGVNQEVAALGMEMSSLEKALILTESYRKSLKKMPPRVSGRRRAA